MLTPAEYISQWQKPGRTVFIVKVATTLDHVMATSSGHSQWITGAEARHNVMQWRRACAAVGVGAGTLLADNPRLTVREDGKNEVEQSRIRLVIDATLRSLPELGRLHVFQDAFAGKTLLLTGASVEGEALAQLEEAGVWYQCLPREGGRLSFEDIRNYCQRAGISSVLWEAGPGLASAILAEASADVLLHYRAACVGGDAAAMRLVIPQGLPLSTVAQAQYGEDSLTIYRT